MGRIKSATLVETMVAAVIVITIFISAMVVFVQVNRHAVTVPVLKAKKLIDVYAAQASENDHFVEMAEWQNGLQVQQSLVTVLFNKAVRVRFVVTDKNNNILEQQERTILLK